MTGCAHPVRTTCLALVLLGVAQFGLACRLAVLQPETGDDHSVIDRWLGGVRALLASTMRDRADLYLHRGAEAVNATESHAFFGRWRGKLVPAGHVHQKADDVKELLPWMRLAAKFEPEDAKSYLNAIYWARLAGAGERPLDDLFLEASRRNPTYYVIPMDWARQELRREAWDNARRRLDLALALWPQPLTADAWEAREDRVLMLQMRGMLKASANDREGALADLRAALPLTARPALLRDRIAAMEKGSETAAQALAALRLAFGKPKKTEPIACERDDAEPAGHVHGPGEAPDDDDHDAGSAPKPIESRP